MSLGDLEKRTLLRLAHSSIHEGLRCGKPATPQPSDLQGTLGEWGAAFVTLTKRGELRGCIGSLKPRRPLAEDVTENAFSAAFSDARFPKVKLAEEKYLDIKISVLTSEVPIYFGSEEDLIRQLRPGIDGLVLTEGYNRGTFLPSVWEQLPDPYDFLSHLKRKAGLPGNYWSDTIQITRYMTEQF